jgi:hypothetical protein
MVPLKSYVLHTCREQPVTKLRVVLHTVRKWRDGASKALVLFRKAPARDESFTPLAPITCKAAALAPTLAYASASPPWV